MPLGGIGAGLLGAAGGGAFGMAPAIGAVLVSVALDNGPLKKGLAESKAALDGFAAAGGANMKKFGGLMSKVALAGAAAWVAFAASGIKAAADLTESINKVNNVFGASAEEVKKFAEGANAIGLAKAEAMDAAASFGAMFKAMGVAEKQTTKWSMSLVKLASDLGSFFNVDPGEMLERLRSGLSGEMEALRRFGIVLSATRVQAEAVRIGLAKMGQELTDEQKLQARYSLILKDSAVAANDFAETVGSSLPNQLRVLRATLVDTAASAGSVFLPAVLAILKTVTPLLGVIRPLSPLLTKLALAFLAYKAITFLPKLLVAIAAGMQAVGVSAAATSRVFGFGLALRGLAGRLGALGAIAAITIPLLDDLKRALNPDANEVGSSFDVNFRKVQDIKDQLRENLFTFSAGSRTKQATQVVANVISDLTKTGLTHREAWQRVNSVWAQSVEVLGGFHGNVDAFDTTLRDHVGLVRRGFGAHKEQIEAIARERDMYGNLKPAIEAANVTVNAAANYHRNLANAHIAATQAAREQALAENELAGGLLGIASASMEAKRSSGDLAEARRTVEKLEKRGKTHTQAYRDAVAALREAQLRATQSQLNLSSAVNEFAEKVRTGEITMGEAKARLREMASQAGLTKAETKKLIDQVAGLIKKYDEVPPKVTTRVNLIGENLVYDAIHRVRHALYLLDGSRADVLIAPRIGSRENRADGGVFGLASGGILTAPRFLSGHGRTVLAGEGRYFTPFGSGAEAILPLNDRTMKRLAGAISKQGGGGPTIVINFNGPVLGKSGREVAKQLAPELTRRMRREGVLAS